MYRGSRRSFRQATAITTTAWDSSDFTLLIGAFNSDETIPGSGYDPKGDFNSDGSVDSTDFTLLIGEFQQHRRSVIAGEGEGQGRLGLKRPCVFCAIKGNLMKRIYPSAILFLALTTLFLPAAGRAQEVLFPGNAYPTSFL